MTQISMNLPAASKPKKSWAFAVIQGRDLSIRQALRPSYDYIISSCSKEARQLGVRAGMRYESAKKLVPGIKILLIGGGSYAR